MSQDIESSEVVGASQEDDASHGRCLQVERPRVGEGKSSGSVEDELAMSFSGGVDVSAGAFAQVVEGVWEEAIPDFGLPESVEGFDGGLEAGFARRGKDGRDAEAQAQADDASQGIGKIMWSLEAGVVVELSVSGQADEPPVFEEAVEDDVGDDALVRPGSVETAMEGDAGEDVDIVAAWQSESFDDVEGIEFDAFVGEIGEIPPSWRRRPSDAFSAIEESASMEDASDGADGGSELAGLAQKELDGQGAAFAEIAGGEQGADFNDAHFDVVLESSGASWQGGSIAPVDAIEA